MFELLPDVSAAFPESAASGARFAAQAARMVRIMQSLVPARAKGRRIVMRTMWRCRR